MVSKKVKVKIMFILNAMLIHDQKVLKFDPVFLATYHAYFHRKNVLKKLNIAEKDPDYSLYL